ncbi:AAA domain-containing protein [Waltera sp.]|uniref:AAA domain-containing protein n=1 Tax=Waltera sp. TaxID=2815806 RepID=UPI00399EF25A
MFPHLFNSLSIVIPCTIFYICICWKILKHAGNMSLGMLIIDESGQAIPQSALGALYRTKRAVVVGDPLQVEPVVTIPKVLK